MLCRYFFSALGTIRCHLNKMAHSSLNQYLEQVENAINQRDGPRAAELLSFKHAHIANPKLQHLENPEGQCERWFDQPYDELIAAHLKCIQCVANHDFVEAYAYQSIVVHQTNVSSFNRIFQSQKDDNWALPIMYAVVLDLRLFSSSADAQLSKKGKGKPGEKLEKAADTLMGCFRICAADSRASADDSKKWGMLYLVNQLFKIYFKTSNLQLCKPLIRAIDSSSYKDQFSISQRVTYRYYVGRKAMFDSDFKSAEEYLTFAFQRCHKASRRNKRLILIYLLPVKMLLGQMPKISLLKKYDLMQFVDVARAVIEGNLQLLNKAIETHETFFAKCGVYLIVDKLKIITYRNLFKKVYMIVNSFQLSIEKFVAVLTFLELDDVDSAEVECILANLIYQGYIKGYISHQHQKLVVSKQNPFPSLVSFLC